jgi:hypothetical protein
MSFENAAADTTRRRIGENNRGREKNDGATPRNLGQDIARAAGAEDGRT